MELFSALKKDEAVSLAQEWIQVENNYIKHIKTIAKRILHIFSLIVSPGFL